ncbi:hypothetical protein [Phenylobacterium sp.]|jgi:hypothetical protein|uniref:hypothetical protein n=1 Tax=Phenylobacterium sp. TaxID=1871053 RepID=UPI002F3F47FE
MDIHKPKPWHGLREFLKEYLIIVVGVLTALGAEQVVETQHWRHEVEVAKEAIAFDLKRTVGGAAAQDAHTVCTVERLREIDEVIDQAQRTGRLPPLGWSFQPPSATWTFESWSALTSGQILSHFPNREQIILSGLASELERMREMRRVESDDWATLEMLSGAGRPIGDAEIAQARIAANHALRDAGQLKVSARLAESFVARSRLLSAAELDRAFQEGLKVALNTGICLPRPAPSKSLPDQVAHYFVAPAARPGDLKQTGDLGVGGAFTLEK